MDHRVAVVEDAYIGEDGSIQCLVTWKPSLVSIENLDSEELRRRSGELFEKRYGYEELQRTAAVQPQTKKR